MAFVHDHPGPAARDRGVAEGVDQVSGQAVDEAVPVRGLHPWVVVVEPDDRLVGPDADQQRAAVGVEEPGDGLDHRVLHRLAGLALTEVPAGGGLQLDGHVSSGRMTTRFFVRGIRHVEGAEPVLSALSVGEHLSLAADAVNAVNRLAIHVATGSGSVIGWVPDYLVAPLRRAMGDHLDLADVVAERVNPPGTPRQTRVLCRVEVPVPPGFAAFAEPEFLEIDASPGSR